jgi:hypothetical protein
MKEFLQNKAAMAWRQYGVKTILYRMYRTYFYIQGTVSRDFQLRVLVKKFPPGHFKSHISAIFVIMRKDIYNSWLTTG